MANTVGLQCIFAATVPKYCTKAPQNVAANSRGMPREILRENSEGNKTVPLSICGYLKILFTDSSSIRSHYIPFNDIISLQPGFMGVAVKRKVPRENQCGKEVSLTVFNPISSPEKLCSAPKAYISHGKQL